MNDMIILTCYSETKSKPNGFMLICQVILETYGSDQASHNNFDASVSIKTSSD